jgi:hypothetical protein
MSSGLVINFYENTFYFIQTISDSDDNQTRVLWLNPLLHYYPYSLNQSEFYSGQKRRNTTYLDFWRRFLLYFDHLMRILSIPTLNLVSPITLDSFFTKTK